jgi:hypothetical protein
MPDPYFSSGLPRSHSTCRTVFPSRNPQLQAGISGPVGDMSSGLAAGLARQAGGDRLEIIARCDAETRLRRANQNTSPRVLRKF